MTTQNSAMGDEKLRSALIEALSKSAHGFHSSQLEAIWPLITSRDQQIALAADIDARKGMGARLNKAIFFSTTQPDGQFVKDCIIAELDAANKDHKKLLKQAQNKEK